MKKKQEVVLRINDAEAFEKYKNPEFNKIIGKYF